jgi:drug/metabolite transporter (DMT)-like permease
MINSLFVVLGAALWAADTLFRHPMIQQISPLTIVFLEHVAVLGMSAVPLLLLRQNPFKLTQTQWAGAFLVGALGSAIATLLFTASFQFVNPTVAILLQKVQPLIVVSLSFLFLGERPKPLFWGWAGLALVAAFFMSFPDGISLAELHMADESGSFRGAGLALSAAGIWAVSTVIGKSILRTVPSETLSFWRFGFGLLACSVFVTMSQQTRMEIPFVMADTSILKSIFWMGAIAGFLGVGLYYRGLSKIPASVATLLELSFPLAAMWINSQFLDLHLNGVQLSSALFLMIAMIGVSRTARA